MTRNIRVLILILVATQLIQSQTLLSVDEALKTALEKNYGVLMAKNTEQISQTQNNFGNAGLSPTVSLNAAYNFANLNSHQEFNSGVVQDKEGAITKNVAASINANWTVFDGLKMFAIKKRLEANQQSANLALKQQMENLIYQTIVAYNNIIKVKSLIKSAEQNLILVEERNNLAKVKYNIGSDSKMDYLLAQSNERKIRSELSQLQIQLLNAKTALNLLMTKSADNNFETSDSIVVNFNPSIEDLKKTAPNSNKSILLSKQNEIQFEQSIKEAQAATLPQIQINTAYNFTRNQSQAGIVFLNRQAGLNAGLSASWLIFNGNKNAKLVQERKLLFLNQQYNTAQANLQMDAWLYLQYEVFLLNKKSLAYEYESLQMAKEVLEISLKRYQLGKTNFIETLDMQNVYEAAQSRYINALYNLKVGETDLMKTAGILLK